MNKLTKIALSIAAVGMASFLFGQPATQPAGEKVLCESGLTIITVEKGGHVTQKGDHVWVHYAGRLENGTEFDNSFNLRN